MARPKSEDKRNTILQVATQVFARNGLSASTASITNGAGMAEGSLFTYFKGKDDLINALYSSIKLEMADAMMAGYPRKANVRTRTQHIWNQYVEWGVENPDQLAVVHKIMVWEGLRPEVRAAAMVPFAEVHALTESAIEQGVLQDIPRDFITAMLVAQAEATMQFMRQDPASSSLYKEKGFEIYWNGISRKK